ncbi:MAG: acyl--CoA ligase [Calothrix sp. SM1_5_4]|nr:acyl--CoA ligase [Calothrix sp. SM1_5_4]
MTPAPSYSCIMGGAAVSKTLWSNVRDELAIVAPSIGYGCTEASPGITHLPPGTEPSEDGEIGYPLASLSSDPTGDGVRIEGTSLCMALIQDGQAEFPEHLMIRDRVRVGIEGRWIYEGRLDLTLNRGGQKFSLENIERELHQALGVGVVAVSVRDSRLGEDLGLVLVASGEEQKMLKRAEEILQSGFGLRLNTGRVRFVTDFPLNECSKIDRRSLNALFAEKLPS